MAMTSAASFRATPLVRTLGALALAPAVASAWGIPGLTQPQLYDCSAEWAYWQTAWTPEWKAWCCEHHKKGCPTTWPSTATVTETQTATATTTATTTATVTQTGTTTTTMAPCDQDCVVDGMAASCTARVQWTSKHMTASEENSCEKAYAMVLSQCSAECSSCNLEQAGCAVPADDLQFRQKFEQPAVQVQSAAVDGRGRGHLLPVNTAIGMVVAFLSSSALAVVFRSRGGTHSNYQNLLHAEDYMDDDYTSSSDMEGSFASSDLES